MELANIEQVNVRRGVGYPLPHNRVKFVSVTVLM